MGSTLTSSTPSESRTSRATIRWRHYQQLFGVFCRISVSHVTSSHSSQRGCKNIKNPNEFCNDHFLIQSIQGFVTFFFSSLFSVVYFNQGGSDDRGVHIRALFTELLRAKKPLVLHNGLIDMAFLYQVPVIYSWWICINSIFCLN